MIPAPPERHVAGEGGAHGRGVQGPNAEWASYWASLTFEPRPADAAR